ncbi:MAG: hypothetical protein WDW38_008747 [Sanguina aurantia]
MYQLLITIPSTVAPVSYARHARPWLVALTTACCVTPLFLSLLTHPTAPPALYWTTFFPLNGVMLLCQHTAMRMEGASGRAQIALHVILTTLSMLVLPKVYPRLSWPVWTLPLTLLSAGICWAMLPEAATHRHTGPTPRASHTSAPAAAQPALPTQLGGQELRKGCRSSIESAGGWEEGQGACSVPGKDAPAGCSDSTTRLYALDAQGGVLSSPGAGMDDDTSVGGVSVGGAAATGSDIKVDTSGLGQAGGGMEGVTPGAGAGLLSDTGCDGGEGAVAVSSPVPTRSSSSSAVAPAAMRRSSSELARLMLAFQKRGYVSQNRPIRMVTKIQDLEPEDLSDDFLLKISVSLASHPTHPYLMVGASVRRGCVELTMDLVPMSRNCCAGGSWDPVGGGDLDPALWLQHLHVNPPRGTQVLSQACGRVWRSTWNDPQGQWLLSPFPLPTAEIPRILRAPVVVFRPTSSSSSSSSSSTGPPCPDHPDSLAASYHSPHTPGNFMQIPDTLFSPWPGSSTSPSVGSESLAVPEPGSKRSGTPDCAVQTLSPGTPYPPATPIKPAPAPPAFPQLPSTHSAVAPTPSSTAPFPVSQASTAPSPLTHGHTVQHTVPSPSPGSPVSDFGKHPPSARAEYPVSGTGPHMLAAPAGDDNVFETGVPPPSSAPSQHGGCGVAHVGTQPLRLGVEVSSFGIAPDLRMRCKGSYLQVSSAPAELVSYGGPGGQGGSHAFEVTIDGGLPSSDLLMLECKLGWMLCDTAPVLLMGDALLAAELQELLGPGEEGEGAARHRDILVDLGAWLDYTECMRLPPLPLPPPSPSTPSPRQSLERPPPLPQQQQQQQQEQQPPPMAHPAVPSMRPAAATTTTAAAAAAPQPTASPLLPQAPQGPTSVPASGAECAATVAAPPAAAAAAAPAAAAGAGAAEQPGSPHEPEDAPSQPAAPPPLPAASSPLRCASQLAAIYRSPAMHLHMGQTGSSLLVSAVDNGCTHMAQTVLLGLLAAGHAYAWVLEECANEIGSMSLLQHAVGSGSSAMVDLVVGWGGGARRPLRKRSVDDGGALAQRVLSEYYAACHTWLGLTPPTMSGPSDPRVDLIAAATVATGPRPPHHPPAAVKPAAVVDSTGGSGRSGVGSGREGEGEGGGGWGGDVQPESGGGRAQARERLGRDRAATSAVAAAAGVVGEVGAPIAAARRTPPTGGVWEAVWGGWWCTPHGDAVCLTRAFNLLTSAALLFKLRSTLLGGPREDAGPMLLLLALQLVKSAWPWAGIGHPHKTDAAAGRQPPSLSAQVHPYTYFIYHMLDAGVTTFLVTHNAFNHVAEGSGSKAVAFPAAVAWCLGSAALSMAVGSCER